METTIRKALQVLKRRAAQRVEYGVEDGDDDDDDDDENKNINDEGGRRVDVEDLKEMRRAAETIEAVVRREGRQSIDKASSSTLDEASLDQTAEETLQVIASAIVSVGNTIYVMGQPDDSAFESIAVIDSFYELWSALVATALRVIGRLDSIQHFGDGFAASGKATTSATNRTHFRRQIGQFCSKTAPTCVKLIRNEIKVVKTSMYNSRLSKEQYSTETTEKRLMSILQLLDGLLKYNPLSLRHLHSDIEQTICLVIPFRRVNCSPLMCRLTALAVQSLAATVKCIQDRAFAWSELTRRTLLELHFILDEQIWIFGSSGTSKRLGKEATDRLTPVGIDPPQKLFPKNGNSKTHGPESLGDYDPDCLFHSCILLLESLLKLRGCGTVALLITSELALIKRVLSIRVTKVKSEEKEILLAEQISSLSLLKVILDVCQSDPLLSHTSDILKIIEFAFVTPCFNIKHRSVVRELSASLRKMAFTISKLYIDVFKAAGALSIVNILIINAAQDLESIINMNATKKLENTEDIAMRAALQEASLKRKRRRKDQATKDADAERQISIEYSSFDRDGMVKVSTSALEAMQALLNNGGEILPTDFRRRIDSLISEVETCSRNPLMIHREDFKMAAKNALIMSILVPSSARPANFADAISLLSSLPAGVTVPSYMTNVAIESTIHPAQFAALPSYTEAPFNTDFFSVDTLKRKRASNGPSGMTSESDQKKSTVRIPNEPNVPNVPNVPNEPNEPNVPNVPVISVINSPGEERLTCEAQGGNSELKQSSLIFEEVDVGDDNTKPMIDHNLTSLKTKNSDQIALRQTVYDSLEHGELPYKKNPNVLSVNVNQDPQKETVIPVQKVVHTETLNQDVLASEPSSSFSDPLPEIIDGDPDSDSDVLTS